MPDPSDSESIRFHFKLVLLGDGGTGKTCILRRFCFNEFGEDTKLTIGLSFNSYSLLAHENGKRFRIGLSIWDFGGQPRFRPLLPQFIQGCSGAFLCFDQTAFHSLESLVHDWRPMLSTNAGSVPSILVGTKQDLLTDANEIDPTIIEQYRVQLGAFRFISTSAKTGYNTILIFNEIVKKILQYHPFQNREIRIEE